MKDQFIPIEAYNAQEIREMNLEPTRFCVQSLLPQGLALLGGAPKIGKSWLVLDLCIQIAKGEKIWDLPTAQGTTLYLCLEDTYQSILERIDAVADDMPDNAYFAPQSESMAGGLEKQIRYFAANHPDTGLIAVDTFQMVRQSVKDSSYGSDYQDVSALKKLADELKITLLLVHHLRKQGDDDPLNRLSGTTGISGAADTILIFERDKRSENEAKLKCTGRGIETRELKLEMSKETCRWELRSDSLFTPSVLLPKEISALIEWMEEQEFYSGGNSELAAIFSERSGITLSAKALKQFMNRYRYDLERNGVLFESSRSSGQRYVKVWFNSGGDASDGKDE